jgi:hypothetical protein
LNLPMPINPGKHRLTAASFGRTSFAGDVELGTGEVRQLSIELPVATTVPQPRPAPARVAAQPSAPASSTRASASPAASDSWISTRTIVLASEATLFAAGLTAGVISTLARGSADDRYQTANEAVLASVGGSDPNGVACGGDSPPSACTELRDAGQARTRAANVATAGFITAGVSAAAFGLTYWLWSEAPATATASLRPGAFELLVTGRF